MGRWADQTEPDRREIAADPRKPKITPHKTALFEVPTSPSPSDTSGEAKGTAKSPYFVKVMPAPKSAEDRAHEIQDREEKKSADSWLVRWTASLFFATVGLILATVALGYFAFQQMRDMKHSIAVAKDAATAAKEQVQLSRNALINTERAIVFHSKTHAMAGIKGSTNEVIDWNFFAILENAGSTPTKWMQMHTNWYYFAGGIPDNFDFPDISDITERPFCVIGPKGTTLSGECVVPIDKIFATRNGAGQLFIWGWVEYDDIFEGTFRHRTEYCMEVKVPGIPTIHTAEGNPENFHLPFQYQGYRKHNGIDDECMLPLRTGSPKNPLQK